ARAHTCLSTTNFIQQRELVDAAVAMRDVARRLSWSGRRESNPRMQLGSFQAYKGLGCKTVHFGAK
ncbi:MAG: hypothetical protein WA866_14095, partial [Pseudolabrys sp.]